MGFVNIFNNGGGANIELVVTEIGEHSYGLAASKNLRTYVNNTDISPVCTYTPSILNAAGEQEVTINFCNKIVAKKTINVTRDYSYNFFTYTGDYDFYDADHKILLLKSSGTFKYEGQESTAVLIAGGANGSSTNSSSKWGAAGGNGGQTLSRVIPEQTNATITIGGIAGNTVAFGYTTTGAGGSAGGADRSSIGSYGNGNAGTAGTTYTLGTTTIQPGGGGGSGSSGSWLSTGYTGGAGGTTGGGKGGDANSSGYNGKNATFYGSGGGGGAGYNYNGGWNYGTGGTGYQGAIFLYNGNVWYPRMRVGGKIFYVNSDSTGDATYTFYDQNFTKLTNHTVAGLANAYYYCKVGTNTTDKFYVYDTTNGLQTDKKWGYQGSSTGATTDGIGYGKTNTATVLSKGTPASGTIWDYVKTCNTNALNGQSDWYIPSIAEQTVLRDTGYVNWYVNNKIWSAVEQSANNSYRWDYSTLQWVSEAKTTNNVCFVTRSM